VHYLRDPKSKQFNYDPYLQKISEPSMVDLSSLPPFIRPSQDEVRRGAVPARDLPLPNAGRNLPARPGPRAASQTLWGLAQSLKRRFIGSTSSLTVALCQIYFLISRYRPVNTSLLSGAFHNEVRCAGATGGGIQRQAKNSCRRSAL